MRRPADQPPIVPVVPGPGVHSAPPPVVVVTESKTTKVARVVGIIRDVAVILILAALVYLGSAIMSHVSGLDGTNDGVSGDKPSACAVPSTDQWGTFCPETPDGG